MVDQTKRKIIDLIEGRDIETVSNWLKKFPNIKIISRDGSTSYRTSIEKTNINILQISDRFHLLKNLSELLSEFIRNNYNKNIMITESNTNDDNNEFNEEYNRLSKKAKENYDRKNIEFNLVKKYYNKYNDYSKTAKKVGINWRTVKEYVHMNRLPISKRKSSSSLDKYRNTIIDNIDKSLKEIYKIIQKKGYKGTYSNLKAYIKSRNLKISENQKSIYINRTTVINLLNHKGISDLGIDDIEQENLKKLLKKDKTISKIIKINDDFYNVIFSGNSKKIDSWIQEAKKLNIEKLNTFIATTEKDITAISNAITYQYLSNGLIEGKNCKMKLIKRIMYGRCSTKLLRAKLIQLG